MSRVTNCAIYHHSLNAYFHAVSRDHSDVKGIGWLSCFVLFYFHPLKSRRENIVTLTLWVGEYCSGTRAEEREMHCLLQAAISSISFRNFPCFALSILCITRELCCWSVLLYIERSMDKSQSHVSASSHWYFQMATHKESEHSWLCMSTPGNYHKSFPIRLVCTSAV